MTSNLPDDQDVKEPEEDAPVKTSYHSLEDDDETEEEPEKTKDLPEHQFKKEFIGQSETDNQDQYYLQALRTGEAPEWPRSKEDLDVFSQPLGGGLIQYWAYFKDSGKTADSVPHAEEVASQNKSGSPAIIIDQIADHLTPGSCLELVLAKGGHALAKTDSNLDNLESNITSLLDLAKQNFGITAEHFMSTGNVSPEVEKRLDDLEEAETGEGQKEYNQDQRETKMEEKNSSPYFTDKSAITSEKKRSKIAVFIPILMLILVFGGVIFYRDKLLSKLMNIINSPKPAVVETTPVSTPTPTPTITVDRSKYKVRILNGTPKTGAAGTLADKLTELGWQIDKTGNATSSAIAESYVRGKTGINDAIKALISDVSDYQAASSSADLKPADKADLEFVIGKK